jgi:hypothetical protein
MYVERMMRVFIRHGCKVPLRRVGPMRYTLSNRVDGITTTLALTPMDGGVFGECSWLATRDMLCGDARHTACRVCRAVETRHNGLLPLVEFLRASIGLQ